MELISKKESNKNASKSPQPKLLKESLKRLLGDGLVDPSPSHFKQNATKLFMKNALRQGLLLAKVS